MSLLGVRNEMYHRRSQGNWRGYCFEDGRRSGDQGIAVPELRLPRDCQDLIPASKEGKSDLVDVEGTCRLVDEYKANINISV